MCYREGRGIVPTAGIRPDRMILKFRGCPRGMATQMYLSHEPPHERQTLPRQIALGRCQCHTGVPNHENL